MFNSIGSIAGFLVGVGMTIGLLLSPHLIPGGIGYGLGLQVSPGAIAAIIAGGILILALTLRVGAKFINGVQHWNDPGTIAAFVLIAFVANALYVFFVEFLMLKSGMRALVAVLGVPIIYGNIISNLRRVSLKEAMLDIFTGALATMGAGFIIVALLKSW